MPYIERHDELVQFVSVLCLRARISKREAEAIIKQHRHEPDTADPEIIAALKARYQLPEIGERGGEGN